MKFVVFTSVLYWALGSVARPGCTTAPPPPSPEPIELVKLPLPPVAPTDEVGACDATVNPRKTGCIAKTGGGAFEESSGVFQQGGFLPDGRHILALVTFAGAPAAPDSASIYNGSQIVILKTDASTFPNGDSWKCLTCGVPAKNKVGMNRLIDYAVAFRDGKRVLIGSNIVDCGENDLASPQCTPNSTFIYPLRWNTSPDGSGATGAMRELRLNPDNVHIGFNAFTNTGGKLGQKSYFARLQFNPSPTTGLPLAPRYDLVNVIILYNDALSRRFTIDGNQLSTNNQAITVGELRGFSGRGGEVVYLGGSVEASNVDVFAVHMQTGRVRRLTAHPEYADPVDISPDDKWTVVMDTRGSNRQMFLAAMRGLPPLSDMVTSSLISSTRNNGIRRFFQPYLIDRYGDRGSYFGQQVNGQGSGVQGSGDFNDPEWNGMADPRWSPDGTMIAFWQTHTVSPACGGENPLPCYESKEPGGRTYRAIVAKFTSRKPLDLPAVQALPDTVAWGIPYVPGSEAPSYPPLSPGNYTLTGKVSGHAEVTLVAGPNSTDIDQVMATYDNYSDDGEVFIDGYENISSVHLALTLTQVHWYSDLVQSGAVNATKKTSPDGFHARIDVLTNYLETNGTLTTTVNGVVYRQPANRT
jgi:hypothetical protein